MSPLNARWWRAFWRAADWSLMSRGYELGHSRRAVIFAGKAALGCGVAVLCFVGQMLVWRSWHGDLPTTWWMMVTAFVTQKIVWHLENKRAPDWLSLFDYGTDYALWMLWQPILLAALGYFDAAGHLFWPLALLFAFCYPWSSE